MLGVNCVLPDGKVGVATISENFPFLFCLLSKFRPPSHQHSHNESCFPLLVITTVPGTTSSPSSLVWLGYLFLSFVEDDLLLDDDSDPVAFWIFIFRFLQDQVVSFCSSKYYSDMSHNRNDGGILWIWVDRRLDAYSIYEIFSPCADWASSPTRVSPLVS